MPTKPSLDKSKYEFCWIKHRRFGDRVYQAHVIPRHVDHEVPSSMQARVVQYEHDFSGLLLSSDEIDNLCQKVDDIKVYDITVYNLNSSNSVNFKNAKYM